MSPKNYGLQRILSTNVVTGKGDKIMNFVLFACFACVLFSLSLFMGKGMHVQWYSSEWRSGDNLWLSLSTMWELNSGHQAW